MATITLFSPTSLSDTSPNFTVDEQVTISAVGLQSGDYITFERLMYNNPAPSSVCGCRIIPPGELNIVGTQQLLCDSCQPCGDYSTTLTPVVRLTARNPVVVLDHPQHVVLRATFFGAGLAAGDVYVTATDTTTQDLTAGMRGCPPLVCGEDYPEVWTTHPCTRRCDDAAETVEIQETSNCGNSRWVTDPASEVAGWTYWRTTGAVRCDIGAGTYEEEAVNPCGNASWISGGGGGTLTWTETGVYDCRNNVNFRQDVNQCGETRWVDTGETCGDSTHTLTSFTATAVNVIEGQTACWNVVLDSAVFGSPLVVEFDLSGADQVRNSYPTPQSITILPGASSGQLCITTTDDTVVDGVEPLCATPRNSTRLVAGPGAVCINVSDNDEDTYDVTSFTQTTPDPVTEGEVVCWDVVVDRPVTTSPLDLTVMWGGADHVRNTYPNTTFSIAVGATTGNLCIQTTDDTDVDGTEQLCVAGFVANSRLGSVPALPCVDVLDNDSSGSGGSTHTILSIVPVTNPIIEGDQACWTVTLDAAVATTALPINFTLSGADQARNSYTNPSITIPIGSTTGTVCVTTTDDVVVDGTEQLCITANTSGRITAVPAASCIDVQDNDVAPSTHTVLTVTPVDPDIIEGEQACWTVTLDSNVAVTALPITLNLTGSEQTAHGYSAPTGSIPVGSNSTVICVTTTDDVVVDGTTVLCATVATSARITSVPAASCINVADNDSAGGLVPMGLPDPAILGPAGGTHNVSARLTLTVNTDGTWALSRVRTGDGGISPMPSPASGNWYSPTTPGIGNDYEIEITNTGVIIDQSGYSGTVSGVTAGSATPSTSGYVLLNTAREVEVYTGMMVDGNSTDGGFITVDGTFTLNIRHISGSPDEMSSFTVQIEMNSDF